jgi:hypothetical protein
METNEETSKETRSSFRINGLKGMKQICSHVNMSETTVLKLIRSTGLPAKKIGGQWISDIMLLEQWRINILSS